MGNKKSKFAALFQEYPDVVSVPQLCKMLGVCKGNAYQLLHSGQIKYLRVGQPEFQLPTRQLYVCTGGFGAYPKSRGSACFCTSLYSGKHTRFEREDILATMDIKAVPQWAQENLRKALSEEKKLNQKKEAAR